MEGGCVVISRQAIIAIIMVARFANKLCKQTLIASLHTFCRRCSVEDSCTDVVTMDPTAVVDFGETESMVGRQHC